MRTGLIIGTVIAGGIAAYSALLTVRGPSTHTAPQVKVENKAIKRQTGSTTSTAPNKRRINTASSDTSTAVIAATVFSDSYSSSSYSSSCDSSSSSFDSGSCY